MNKNYQRYFKSLLLFVMNFLCGSITLWIFLSLINGTSTISYWSDGSKHGFTLGEIFIVGSSAIISITINFKDQHGN